MLQHESHPGNLACAALLNATHPTISMGCGLTVDQILGPNGLWAAFLNNQITAGELKAFLGAAFNSGEA
jgi:hypothetical protein